MDQLAVATWNLHRFVGTDGRRAPERVLEVVRELDADVFAFQEVELHDPVFREGLEALGLHVLEGATLPTPAYGNLLATRQPVRNPRTLDLSVGEREPRAALVAELGDRGSEAGAIAVVATHLGLSWRERRVQARRLLGAVTHASPTLLLGDLNDWPPALGTLHRRWRAHGARSFPSRVPLLALDRVCVSPHLEIVSAAPHRSALSRRASDHLPVRARVRRR